MKKVIYTLILISAASIQAKTIPNTIQKVPAIFKLFDEKLPQNKEARASILNSIWVQAYLMKQNIIEHGLENKNLTLIAHSQGGLVCLAFIALFGHEFTIERLITINSPLRGVSAPPIDAYEMKKMGWYSELLKKYKIPNKSGHLLLYSPPFQLGMSVSGFWNNPKQRGAYLQCCTFLPILYGEVKSNMLQQFKNNINNLKEIICFGSIEDKMVVPWNSSLFADHLIDSNDFTKTRVYKKNLLGFKDMYDQGKLKLRAGHGTHGDPSDFGKLTQRFILPFLNNINVDSAILLKSGALCSGNYLQRIHDEIKEYFFLKQLPIPNIRTICIDDYMDIDELKNILPKEVFNRKNPLQTIELFSNASLPAKYIHRKILFLCRFLNPTHPGFLS